MESLEVQRKQEITELKTALEENGLKNDKTRVKGYKTEVQIQNKNIKRKGMEIKNKCCVFCADFR